MLEFTLPPEHEALRKTVQDFARTEVAPAAAALNQHAEFPYDLVATMGRMGLFGLPFPEDVGGSGGDYLALCVALEELARVDSSVAVALSAGVSLGAMPVHRFGTEEQRRTLLPDLCAGIGLAAFGLTEPQAGTDAAATRTRAEWDCDSWILNGSKCFITNSGTALTRFINVTAVTGTRAGGGPEISTIMVPRDNPGLSIAPSYSKLGWCASDTHGLTLTDCRVPGANLLGTRGRGIAQFLAILDESRIALAAVGTGLAQGCIDECVDYARQRKAFGQPIGAFQAIGFKIADMQVRVHTARLAYYAAAAKMLRGEPFKTEAAIAKLVASNAAMDNSRDATQVFGGYGCMNDYAVTRFYRDAKVLEIGEGTSEVQRMVIARSLGLAG